MIWWQVINIEKTSRGDLNQTSQQLEWEEARYPYALYNS
ncbi:hypothetical protein BDGGKGIB_00123 [Nodularia sphaerocarpa UHCC 0038]|nr:hypothetical protein BDGGKGIB_00123 [Nodularia sphaerocarpa UHCC 0038]